MSLLGIDIGPTSCRVLAIALDGRPVAQAQREYAPSVSPQGARLLDPQVVWNAVREAIAQVAARSRSDPIKALSVSSMAEALTPITADGRFAGPCLLDVEERDPCEQQVLERLGSQRLFELTGNVPGTTGALSNLCWLRRHQPESFQRAWKFLPWSSLVAYLLGAASLADYTLADRSMAFDLARERWAREVLQAAKLPEDKLPEVTAAGTLVGTAAGGMARELGLPPSVVVAVGAHERCCAALGVGAVRSGMAVCNLAAAITLTPVFHAVPLAALMLARGLGIQHHLVPSLFVSLLYLPSGGALLRWFRETLAPAEVRLATRQGLSAIDQLLAEMSPEPTSLLVLPPVGSPSPANRESHAAGAILGLTPTTTRPELVKALLEGMSLSLADGRHLLEQAGVPVQTCRATGAGVRSEAWLQLTADVLGVPVEETGVLAPAALGAAMLAGVGSGAYAGFAQAVDTVVRAQGRFEPDPNRHALYAARLETFRTLAAQLADPLRDLSQR